jgi:hypothetical protein
MSDQSKTLRSKLCIEDVCQFDEGCGCLEAIDDALVPLRAENEDLKSANALLHGLVSNRDTEIERLRDDLTMARSDWNNCIEDRKRLEAALREIERVGSVDRACNIARRALEGK